MKRLIFSSLIAMLSLILVIGCDKNPNSAISEDELELSAIEESMQDESNEYLIDWGLDDVDENNMFDGYSDFSFGKVMIPLNNVVRFGRKIDKKGIRTLILRRISRDSIMAISERVLVGKFVSFDKISNSNTNSDTFGITRKPMKHVVKRKTIFVRKDASIDAAAVKDPRRRFRLAEISISEGESRPTNTVQIEQVNIESTSGYSATFSDPLNEFLNVPDELPTLVRGDSVTVIALVSNSTANPVVDSSGASETLLLHFGISPRHHARKRFAFKGVDPATGYNMYKGVWMVREPARRPYHCVIDAIDNGTIYDDDNEMYPYNSSSWGVPYRVVLTPDVTQAQ